MFSFHTKNRGRFDDARPLFEQFRTLKTFARQKLRARFPALATSRVGRETHVLEHTARLVRFDERAELLAGINQVLADCARHLLRVRPALGARGDQRPDASAKVVGGGLWVPQLAGRSDGGWAFPCTIRADDFDAAQRSDATIAACVEELLGLADETTRRECAQHSPNGITEGIVCSYTTFTGCDAPWAAAHTDKGDAQDTTTGMRLGLIVVVDM